MRKSRALLWRILDPMLIKVAARLAHLENTYPSDYTAAKWRGIARFGETVRFFHEAKLANFAKPDDLCIGDYTHVAGELSIIAPGGRLQVGNYCFIGPGTRVWAQTSVTIGNHVLISHYVDIHDTNAHSTNAILRRQDPVNLFERGTQIDWRNVNSKAVVIEDDVWIGFKSSILKGVTVGKGAIVAAGAMVIKDVPQYTLVAGNPARVIRQLDGGFE